MKLRALLLAAATTVAAMPAFAMLPTTEQTAATQNTANYELMNRQINAFVVRTDAQGVESLVPLAVSDTVNKGDIVEYQGLFTNQDTNRVRKLVVSLSIPEGAELVGGVSPMAQGSIDNTRFTRMPVKANIGGVIQDLPFKYYKALRWTVEDLGIGATAVVKYRVVVK